jgi:hypothetical protein
VHHSEDYIVSAVAAVVKEERGDEVDGRVVLFLWTDQLLLHIRSARKRLIPHTCKRQYIICRRTYSLCVAKSSPSNMRNMHFAML